MTSHDNLVVDVDLLDCHLILSEGASLVSADLVGTTHSLGGVKATDKVVLLSHLGY